MLITPASASLPHSAEEGPLIISTCCTFPTVMRSRLKVPAVRPINGRSEEHTSELQSRFDLVCRPLLDKKNSSRGLPARTPTRLQPRPPQRHMLVPAPHSR